MGAQAQLALNGGARKLFSNETKIDVGKAALEFIGQSFHTAASKIGEMANAQIPSDDDDRKPFHEIIIKTVIKDIGRVALEFAGQSFYTTASKIGEMANAQIPSNDDDKKPFFTL